jgi:hypothetical protein
MPIGLIIAIICLALIAGGVLLYEMVLKNKTKNLFQGNMHSGSLVIPMPNVKPPKKVGVHLTKNQIKKLFDVVLKNYYNPESVKSGSIKVGLKIKDVGNWTIDNKTIVIGPLHEENSVTITINDFEVINDLINDDEVTAGDLIAMKFRRRIDINGDYNELAEFKSFLNVIVENKKEILEKL